MYLFDAYLLPTPAQNTNDKVAFLITRGSEGLLQLNTSAYAKEESRRSLEGKAPVRLPTFRHQLKSIRLVTDAD